MASARLLVRGGRILSMDSAIGDLACGDLLVEDGRIRAVGPALPVDDCAVLDAAGMIVLPGFVDTHRHVWQTQLRTVATDWSLFDYFSRMRIVYSSFYEPEDVYLGTLVGALEALHAGITTLVDHAHVMNSPAHADEAVRGLVDAGIRAVFCYGLFPNPTQHPFRFGLDPDWRVDDARRLRRTRLAADEARVTMGLAPTEVTATPFDATCAEIRLGRELGARRISCHVSMGLWDKGERVVERLGRAGLLGEDLLLVHGSSLTDDELTMIADSGAGIAATPETELQMGMGHPVAARALARAVPTGLGIDIVSNYSGDMFAQMRLLLQAQRGVEHAAATAPPRTIRFKARDVLALATSGGARVAGLERVAGSLTPGKQADVILLRCDGINMVPALDPVGAVVLNANVHDVDTVLVAGKIVKRDGRLVGVDWPALAERLRRSSARIVEGFDGVARADIEAMAAALMLA